MAIIIVNGYGNNRSYPSNFVKLPVISTSTVIINYKRNFNLIKYITLSTKIKTPIPIMRVYLSNNEVLWENA